MGKPARLRINSILTHVAEADGYVYKNKVDPSSPEELMLQAKAETALRKELLELLPGTSLLSFDLAVAPADLESKPDGTPGVQAPAALELTASVRSSRILMADDVMILEKKLRATLERPVSLLVDSSVGAVASSSGLLQP